MYIRNLLFTILLGAFFINSCTVSGATNIITINGEIHSNNADSVIQGNGNLKKEKRQLSRFNSVIVELSADTEIIQGQTPQVLIEAEENILPLISTEIKNHQLTISSHKGFVTQSGISVTVITPEVTNLEHLSSGDISLSNINQATLTILQNGSGNITAGGMVKTLRATLAGSGDLNLNSLKSTHTTAHLSGAGDINVHAETSLSATITGAGNITYYGSPMTIKEKIDGAGEIMPGD